AAGEAEVVRLPQARHAGRVRVDRRLGARLEDARKLVEARGRAVHHVEADGEELDVRVLRLSLEVVEPEGAASRPRVVGFTERGPDLKAEADVRDRVELAHRRGGGEGDGILASALRARGSRAGDDGAGEDEGSGQ